MEVYVLLLVWELLVSNLVSLIDPLHIDDNLSGNAESSFVVRLKQSMRRDAC
jgi:hypothetical protein